MTSKYSIGDRVYYNNLTLGKRYGIVERIELDKYFMSTLDGNLRIKIWARWGESTTVRWMYEHEVFQDPNDKIVPYDPNQIGDTDDDL